MPKTNKYAAVIKDEDEVAKFVEQLTANHYAAVLSPWHNRDHWTETDVKRFLANNEKRHGIKIDRTKETFEVPNGHYVIVDHKRVACTTTCRIPQVGDLKLPHRHLMVKYDYSVQAVQVIKEFEEMGLKVLYFEPVKSERAYLRYLVHKDNPEKAQYSYKDIISLGGIDTACVLENTAQDKRAIRHEVFDAIRAHPTRSFRNHILTFEEEGRDDLLGEVKGSTFFYRSMMWQDNINPHGHI